MAIANLTWDGKPCSRVVVRLLANNTVVFDTDTLNNYQVDFVVNQYSITVNRYNQDLTNNIILAIQHFVFNPNNSLSFTITY